jgi:hypothetical protein
MEKKYITHRFVVKLKGKKPTGKPYADWRVIS